MENSRDAYWHYLDKFKDTPSHDGRAMSYKEFIEHIESTGEMLQIINGEPVFENIEIVD